ncbi:MAG: hypothetical protein IE922_12720 [Sphingomonadales bacterium]|nr:hypothetical protein [Sphingomonadales bacterium]
MTDLFHGTQPGWTSPISRAFAITPDDDSDLPFITRGIYLGAEGDLTVTLIDGDIVTFTGLAAGGIHGMRIRRVHATGTTAGSLLGVF